MTVYELTDLLKDTFKLDKNFCEKGKVDKDFKLFLDANFGYYCDNILVGNEFGSNILYQYDYEVDSFKSSFNKIQLNLITDWKLSFKNDMFTLSLYEDNILWCDFHIAKLTFVQLI